MSRVSNRDMAFMRRALSLAETSTERQKHGCIVVKSGRVIGVGVNTFRNHPSVVDAPNDDSSYHAEYNALRGLDARGAVVYIGRMAKTGKRLSQPCAKCTVDLVTAGVKRIVWSTNDGYDSKTVKHYQP